MILKVSKRKDKKEFPQDVFDQLYGAISAVFLSWESHRAKVYRKLNQIPSEMGDCCYRSINGFWKYGQMTVPLESCLQEILLKLNE